MPGQYRDLATQLDTRLLDFSQNVTALPGVASPQHRRVLTLQIIDSLRRTQFVRSISIRPVVAARSDPLSGLFDPLRAAVHFRNTGQFDEAHWVAFLGTHCGKHETYGWRLAAAVYSGLQSPNPWSWANVSANPGQFTNWLTNNQQVMLNGQNHYHFSNHRKYESLDVTKQNHTGLVVSSYVNWVNQFGGHSALLNAIQTEVGQNPTAVFDRFFSLMSANVVRFGRLGTFDHVCMLGKLDLAPIVPGKTYIKNATGPRKGAHLLIDGQRDGTTPAGTLEAKLIEIGDFLNLGMQELEDSLCNWQKNPSLYTHFVG
ncbi:hypothetical protein [Litorivita sp. NS0012-18]|uniref:alpha-glutamyl/putrescinyl thymine pyrophosphorylase clade 3 protein n=1 Tax=Litorivita sp. NS0012-18 TaxID=3127655 RepID=UPI003341FCB1